MLDPGSRTLDPGSRMLDPGSKILDPGSRILDPGSRVHHPESRSLDPGSWIQDPGSRILVHGSWIQDPGPGSWIQDPGSRILDPRSRILAEKTLECCDVQTWVAKNNWSVACLQTWEAENHWSVARFKHGKTNKIVVLLFYTGTWVLRKKHNTFEILLINNHCFFIANTQFWGAMLTQIRFCKPLFFIPHTLLLQKNTLFYLSKILFIPRNLNCT